MSNLLSIFCNLQASKVQYFWELKSDELPVKVLLKNEFIKVQYHLEVKYYSKK